MRASEDEEYVDDDVYLLLSDDRVRPGAELAVAVANESDDDSVTYGTYYGLHNAETGTPVDPPKGIVYSLIGLSAAPGEIGPCISVLIPPTTEPGRYEVVLGGRKVGRPEAGEFSVVPPPIENPQWERQLERIQRIQRLNRRG